MARKISSTPPSFFSSLSIRELNGFRVRKRPYLGDLSSDLASFTIEHDGISTPPFAVSFSKRASSNVLAVSDEDGYVSLYNTRHDHPSFDYCREKAAEARMCDWLAHNNAVFDVCWIKDDTEILTASGDQTIKIWNVESRKCLGILSGHTGSIKSVCSHSTDPDLLVSGSRDGSFAFWDLRCKSNSANSLREPRILSTSIVKNAHTNTRGKRVMRGKAASMSITSVLYLKDNISVASASAVDSVIKFWDTRNLKTSVTQACPLEQPVQKGKVLHGISCLSQDSNGMHVAASCMDHRIYLYDVTHLDKGPVKTFCGSKIESFYVKSAISPDGSHILGGSSDGNAYIWRVHKPGSEPIALKGHEGEVTAVDWCSSDYGKLATTSDDYMVRVWNMKRGCSISTRSPTSNRKRIVAHDPTTINCKRLFTDEPESPSKRLIVNNSLFSNEMTSDLFSPVQNKESEKFSTPECQKKRSFTMFFDSEMPKSPESTSDSPASVLNPPSSLKRKTIRDYFLAAS